MKNQPSRESEEEMACKPPNFIYNRYHQPRNTDIQLFLDKNNDINSGMQLFVKSMSRCQHTDCDLCEVIRIQELNETRQRASQMESTMRWWSQCTANWRQKWDTVRVERNRARDESSRLRALLYESKKEIERLIEAKEQNDSEVKSLTLKLQKAQLQNTLQPILQDISAVERIAKVLRSKRQENIMSQLTNTNSNDLQKSLKDAKEQSLEKRIKELEQEAEMTTSDMKKLQEENTKLKEKLENLSDTPFSASQLEFHAITQQWSNKSNTHNDIKTKQKRNSFS